MQRSERWLLKYYVNWLKWEENRKFQFLRNKLAIEKLCDNNNAKYYNTDAEEWEILDYARDLNHYGIESHKKIAKDLLEKIS